MADEEERGWFYVRSIYCSFLLILSQRCSNIARVTRKFLRNSLGDQNLTTSLTNPENLGCKVFLTDDVSTVSGLRSTHLGFFLLSFNTSSKNKYFPMYAAIFVCSCYCAKVLRRFVPRTRNSMFLAVLKNGESGRPKTPREEKQIRESTEVHSPEK